MTTSDITGNKGVHLLYSNLGFLPRCIECRAIYREKGVCLSVRPSVKRVDCDKTEEKFVHILIPYERSFSLVFWKKEWLGRNPNGKSTTRFQWA